MVVGSNLSWQGIKRRQWLFCRRRQFALGIYFAVIIHVCLYTVTVFVTITPVTLWCSGWCAGLEIPWLQVQISAGRALKEGNGYFAVDGILPSETILL